MIETQGKVGTEIVPSAAIVVFVPCLTPPKIADVATGSAYCATHDRAPAAVEERI